MKRGRIHPEISDNDDRLAQNSAAIVGGNAVWIYSTCGQAPQRGWSAVIVCGCGSPYKKNDKKAINY